MDFTITINEAGPETLDKIKPLWQALNLAHLKNSNNFKDHFQQFTFKKRVASLLGKERLKIVMAFHDQTIIGYCLCSINNNIGEIDSIYVVPDYQQHGIGTQLMQKALQWLNEKCDKIHVSVAEGNERVLPFYEQLGFLKRLTVLELNSQAGGQGDL